MAEKEEFKDQEQRIAPSKDTPLHWIAWAVLAYHILFLLGAFTNFMVPKLIAQGFTLVGLDIIGTLLYFVFLVSFPIAIISSFAAGGLLYRRRSDRAIAIALLIAPFAIGFMWFVVPLIF